MTSLVDDIQGFTLLELLMTVIIAGILLALAVPSFSDLIVKYRLITATNDFVTSLNFARSESINRSQQVVVRKVSTQWEGGWQVFVDIDRSTPARQNVMDATDIQLRVYPALPIAFTLRGNSSFLNFIRFQPDGGSSSFGSFVFCDNRDGKNIPQANTAKLITVNAAGRLHLGLDTNKNGIPEKDDGTEIVSCTVSPF